LVKIDFNFIGLFFSAILAKLAFYTLLFSFHLSSGGMYRQFKQSHPTTFYPLEAYI
jgi:hypothetical protein